ncbi:DUF3053 domain-containing protein [Desulfovibrio sp. OttesenSCG-928-I05]|nr:DUF3053 domain-containing protein [Desulfovibrio sp. OttesenSCG-928-I05]
MFQPHVFPCAFFRPAVRLLLLTALVLLLGACGDKAIKEDYAFITFLEKQVLSAAPSAPLAELTGAEREMLGAHAGLYDTMRSSRLALDALLAKDLPRLRDAAALETLADALQQKGIVAEAARSAGELKTALADELGRALGKRRMMRVSDRVGAVYDEAFEKNVAAPARAAGTMLGALEGYFTSLLDLAELLARSGDGYILDGDRVHVTLADLEPAVDGVLKDIMTRRAHLSAASIAYAEALLGR